MSKKKHYEYHERRDYDFIERGIDRAKAHKLKPNDRWRYDPKEVYESEESNEHEDEGW